MTGPGKLLYRGPPNQTKRSPQPLDYCLCTVFLYNVFGAGLGSRLKFQVDLSYRKFIMLYYYIALPLFHCTSEYPRSFREIYEDFTSFLKMVKGSCVGRSFIQHFKRCTVLYCPTPIRNLKQRPTTPVYLAF
jgi:hypothetical protein